MCIEESKASFEPEAETRPFPLRFLRMIGAASCKLASDTGIIHSNTLFPSRDEGRGRRKRGKRKRKMKTKERWECK